jgi:hypothetical protein
MVLTDPGNATHNNVCACGAGQHVMTPGSAGVNPTCTPCEANTYNPAGSLNAAMCTAWTTCSGSQYESTTPSPTVNRGCTNYTSCPAGSGASGGDATHDRTCTACTAGTASGGGAAACSPCAGNTYSGASAASCSACDANATANAGNSACTCNMGFYGTGTTCAAWTNCTPPTQYEATPPSSAANRTCGTCNPGEETTVANQSACTPIAMPDAGM